jgi:hypothetical protein
LHKREQPLIDNTVVDNSRHSPLLYCSPGHLWVPASKDGLLKTPFISIFGYSTILYIILPHPQSLLQFWLMTLPDRLRAV